MSKPFLMIIGIIAGGILGDALGILIEKLIHPNARWMDQSIPIFLGFWIGIIAGGMIGWKFGKKKN